LPQRDLGRLKRYFISTICVQLLSQNPPPLPQLNLANLPPSYAQHHPPCSAPWITRNPPTLTPLRLL
jgi:hypothetical protein